MDSFKELRAQAIEAMCEAMNNLYDDPMCSQPDPSDWIEEATSAFDALHVHFTVNAREVTPEQIAAAWRIFNRHPRERLTPGPGFKEALAAMVAIGDLTKLEVRE
jgi:hypothetical protein